ncbi:MAG: glycosyltransferase [Chthoniobacteraceae bacterium]|jgi:GT2 family glycosyltransferase
MISVVIPTYNRRDCLMRLLASLERQSAQAEEVIVVDDCSTDDTAAVVAGHFPRVTYLRNEENRGPAVSRNRGIREARGKFIVGLDSDTTVEDVRLLEKVSEYFGAHPCATALAFRLYQPDGKTDDHARWWHPLPVKEYAVSAFATDYFSGTGYAFRKAEVVAAGLFPEILYMHYEEVVLALRLIDRGGAIWYCPEFTVSHHANAVSRRGQIRVFYKPRNQVLVTLLCLPFPAAIGYLVPRMVCNFWRALWGGYIPDFFRALVSACHLAAACLEERTPLSRETLLRVQRMHRQHRAA